MDPSSRLGTKGEERIFAGRSAEEGRERRPKTGVGKEVKASGKERRSKREAEEGTGGARCKKAKGRRRRWPGRTMDQIVRGNEPVEVSSSRFRCRDIESQVWRSRGNQLARDPRRVSVGTGEKG